MPLLNKKRAPISPPIPYDSKRKRKEVWYLRFTNEMFTSYDSYIKKLNLYHQAIWECEVTGRKNLTYEQALESERTEQDRAEYKLCYALRKQMLHRVQFQTSQLDDLVTDVYHYFEQNYVIDETVHCRMNGYTYVAKIVDILPGRIVVQHVLKEPVSRQFVPKSNSHHSETEEEEDMEGIEGEQVPRQPNGRLRFPDAFLHPTPQSENDNRLVEERQYKVQLLNEVGQPLEDCRRVVLEHQLDRDRHRFNRFHVQSFIRECAYKEPYINAPWLIKPSVAIAYGMDTALPHHLQHRQDSAFLQASRKRKLTTFKTADEKEAERQARRQESLLQKAILKEERERLRQEKKKQAAIKYPIEDLDLPIYRKDPNLNWALIDMHPQTYHAQHGIIPYPSGGRSGRPRPHGDSPIPPELFDAFLSIWTFLTVFSEPLKLTAYSVDDFERALFHTTHQPKATVLVEYNACLLNVIINERNEDTANELINGDVMETYVESLEEDDSQAESEEEEQSRDRPRSESVLPRVERGWRDKEHLRIAQKWDNKELRANYDRRGWETSLIGCLNDVATPELLPNVDELLQHLVPKMGSTAADREKQYPTLSLKQKLDILSFLIDVVNESTLIRNYMDYCQEQLSEFRKQKVELNKESKALAIKRTEMDKRDKTELELGEEEDSDESDDSCSSRDSNDEDSALESDSSDSRLAARERRHQSRQEKLKQKQREREEQEQQRKKQYAEQREVAKAKSQEQRIKANERRKLEEDERTLRKKEEHLERSMRRYMTLRIRPLGKDRFNNRYYYLDNVGISNTCGSGRLYVHSPSDGDIQLMMERDHQTDLPEQPWGYGGGRWFIKRLMELQGFEEESIWLEDRMNKLSSGHPSEYHGWWKYYTEPEEIDQLLEWLNPKGTREHKLKNELVKQQPYIIESIKKRAQELNQVDTVSKRPSRTTTKSK